MKPTVEQLLGVQPSGQFRKASGPKVSFSLLFFSDVRKDISDACKYEFMRDLTLFGDQEGFAAVYLPERHFHEFGSIFANSAVVAAYLIPQTRRIRFRTAGISLPLHHPAEVVEWWAMNDVLSGGRVDLGFGSGWSKPDFVLSPENYADRRKVCGDRIPVIQKLWRGETVLFPGPMQADGRSEEIPIRIFPRPIQKELKVWLLAFQNDEAFSYAGKQGYNIFTMLNGVNFEMMGKKIALYRSGRKEAGYDPESGIVSLMLHTLVHESRAAVEAAVKQPFKEYIRSSLQAHMQAHREESGDAARDISEGENEKILEYAYQRYFKTGAIFGSVNETRHVVDQAIAIGVNDIACLLDFGAEYSFVKDSLPYLRRLVSLYL